MEKISELGGKIDASGDDAAAQAAATACLCGCRFSDALRRLHGLEDLPKVDLFEGSKGARFAGIRVVAVVPALVRDSRMVNLIAGMI